MGKEWSAIKRKGNKLYKGEVGGVEPIDLFREGRVLWNWCIGEIIAKAYRNRGLEVGVGYLQNCDEEELVKTLEDLDEIIHMAEMMKAVINEAKTKK